MENIVIIKGQVKFTITLDPSVWIFDDRKQDLDSFFVNNDHVESEFEAYTKAASAHWDREIMEGAVSPPTLKSESKFQKEKLLTGTFGIHFKHFLKNAEPLEESASVIIESSDGEHLLSLEEAQKLILAFSDNGKPLVEDGPLHAYLGDGSNRNEPFKHVTAFRVE